LQKILPAVAIVLLLAGCMHPAGDLGECYDGAFTSFCRVDLPNGQAAVAPGTGMMPAIGSALAGVGMVMIGQGTILNGVVAAVHAP
jgi:hypothetical protein